jgi:hypothetical protein
MDTVVSYSLTSDTAKTNQTQVQTKKITLVPARNPVNKNPVQAPVPTTATVEKQQAEAEQTLAKTVNQ